MLNHRLLRREEEVELGKKAIKGDLEARNKLVTYNLRLAWSMSKKYQGHGLLLPDLFQEACVGLMRAAELYDPTTGNRFTTYASYWIRQRILRALQEQSGTIRTPSYAITSALQILRKASEMEVQSGEEVSLEEAGEALGMPALLIQSSLCALKMRAMRSLDITNQDGEYVESMEAEAEEDPRFMAIEDEEFINMLLDRLPARMQNMIRLRYGIGPDNVGTRTLREMAVIFNLTRERVRQITADGIEAMQRMVSCMIEFD